MEDLLLAILGAIKYIWDAIITAVYFFKGVFQVVGMVFKPFVFLADFVTNALPSLNSLQTATSSISEVSEGAKSFFDMVVPSFIWAGVYALVVVVLLIGAIKTFKKT